MGTKTFVIVGLGEILWDLFSDKKQLGGAFGEFRLHHKPSRRRRKNCKSHRT
jgi:hypothetical protein